MIGHVHANVMAEYAEVAKTSNTPWEEFQHSNNGESWHEIATHPRWDFHGYYRRKPKMVRAQSVEFPKPHYESLKKGQQFFVPDIVHNTVNTYFWHGSGSDYNALANGVLHLVEDSAHKHLDAIISLSKKC